MECWELAAAADASAEEAGNFMNWDFMASGGSALDDASARACAALPEPK